jgi:hypothetical protein
LQARFKGRALATITKRESMQQQTIICMKGGTRYGVDYVNKLASMIRRNTQRPTRTVCFTDRPQGIDPGVETASLPPINIPNRVQWLGWRKISVWQAPLLDLQGDVLFLDLDVVVTGSSTSSLISSPVATAWQRTGQSRNCGSAIPRSTAFRSGVGRMTYIHDEFNREPERFLAQLPE